MMKRSFNADFINEVMNHEEVREGCGVPEGERGDLSNAVDDLNNVLLTNDHGGLLYMYKSPGTYEMHTMLLPEGRGRQALDFALETQRYMFIYTDCMRIIGQADPENKGACRFGGRLLNLKGNNTKNNYYSLLYDEWVETEAACREEGERFHQTVETNHGDDEAHDYHVGGALLIAAAGNATKAQHVYNYWAIVAGYQPLNIDSVQPLIMSAGDTRFLFQDGRIIPCHHG